MHASKVKLQWFYIYLLADAESMLIHRVHKQSDLLIERK